MIGNDLVYLPDWPRRSGSRLQRFRQKVYTPEEIVRIENSEHPYLMEALLWAAKEAAYKADVKITRTRSFAPKKLRLQKMLGVASPELLISIDERSYDVKVEREDDYLYALATSVTSQEKETFKIKCNENSTISLQLQGHPIEIWKDEIGIPHGKWQGQELDLTITHDGGMRIYEWYLKQG